MLNWILNSIIYNKDEININEHNDIKKSYNIKKKAVRTIENYYLYYKKKLELNIKRAEKRKLYRILNRTNNSLLKYLKSQKKSTLSNNFQKKY